MSSELVGRRFGNYVVEKLLGEGGMGAVYSAVQPDIGKHVAIKFLAPHLTESPSLVQRFFAEARAVNLIQHENIVDIFDFGQSEDGLVYCVMEVLTGVSLESELAHHIVLPIERTNAIVAQVADALAAAHERNILHRDIKPDNVYLVRRKGNPDFVKVLDFGIAKLGGVGDGSTARTASGTIMGTPGYMSPEQGTAGDVDQRTDIYATGALLYRLLGGQLPFVGRTFGEILQKQLTEEPAPLRTLRPDVPEALERLVHAMVQRDPALRPASMSEVYRCLVDPKALEEVKLPQPVLGARTPMVMSAVTTTLSGAASERVGSPATAPKSARPGWPIYGAVAIAAVGAIGFVATRRAPPASAPIAPPIAAVQNPVMPAPPPPAPDPRFEVKIESTPPGAAIFDGAVLLGTTPATIPFEREQSVRVDHAGFRSETIEIRRDRPTLQVRLTAAAAPPKRRTTALPAPAAPASGPHEKEKRRGDVVKELPF
jgi:serine/threonine-protein kinase